jgi:hypothetical protein
MLQSEIGGWVDDSGNGAYLWFPFATAIEVDSNSRHEVRQKCRVWQANIVKVYHPGKHGLRIDGCFDLSRLKKVIGTQSVKGDIHRLSKFVKADRTADDKIRDAILLLALQADHPAVGVKPSRNLPGKFLRLLKTNRAIQELWLTPDMQNDTSMHDWMLGCELVKEHIDAEDMARILMLNPFGKYQRDRRYDYIQNTVRNLMSRRSSD